VRVSLKVDVEDSSGFKEGLPAILKLFDQYQLKASFLFSTGYDNSGLRIRNFYHPRVLTRQLPLAQKTYGLMLPPASFSRKYKSLMKDCADAGHDIGMKSFDSVTWQSQAIDAGYEWTKKQLQWGMENFENIFDLKPRLHSASGNVINSHLLKLLDEYTFEASFDTRGKMPFYPCYHKRTGKTIQIPVTLPSIEELLMHPEVTLDNVHEYLFAESLKHLPYGHVYEVRAAFEGRQWLSILEKIIVMWRSSQWEFINTTELLEKLKADPLKTHEIGWALYEPDRNHKATQSLPLDN
jgi:undecaprenyl phosphate-alpha-L-ara4FN deformylase